MNRNLEHLYDDSDFTLVPGEPTQQERIAQRELHAARLRRSHFGDPNARDALAECLNGCCPEHRCKLAACLECSTAVQRISTTLVDKTWPVPTELKTFGLVISTLHRPIGQLANVSAEDVFQSLKDLFERAGCAHIPFFGGLDLCLSVDGDGVYPTEWAPHVHFITTAAAAAKLTEKLVPHLPKDERTKRPSVGFVVQNRQRQLRYAFKYTLVKEVRFKAHSRKAYPTTQGLKPRHEVEALLWLGGFNVARRLIIHFPKVSQRHDTPQAA